MLETEYESKIFAKPTFNFWLGTGCLSLRTTPSPLRYPRWQSDLVLLSALQGSLVVRMSYLLQKSAYSAAGTLQAWKFSSDPLLVSILPATAMIEELTIYSNALLLDWPGLWRQKHPYLPIIASPPHWLYKSRYPRSLLEDRLLPYTMS